MRTGNAENAKLNREYAKHVRWGGKKTTAKKRRTTDKCIIHRQITDGCGSTPHLSTTNL